LGLFRDWRKGKHPKQILTNASNMACFWRFILCLFLN